MTEPARNLATYEDVLAAPADVVAEIVDGDLHTSPRPAIRQSRASTLLGGDLSGPFDRGRGGPGGWWLLFEPELHLGADIVVPDLAGWRRDRCPTIPDDAYLTVAPDWVCETLSPRTAGFDRGAKLGVYAREQVPHVWLVDPIARTLEVFVLDGATYRVHAVHSGTVTVRIEPFDAIELELGAWWLGAAPE